MRIDWRGPVLALLAGWALPAATQEAAVVPNPEPVPVAAEAAHQDLKPDEQRRERLDEAIFTDISPLTVPEIGIALPPDQQE